VYTQNCVKVTGLATNIGAVTVEWADSVLENVVATTSSTDYSESGQRVGILITSGGNCFLSNCVGHTSETGIKIDVSRNRLTNCRADLNRGHGFVIQTGGGNQLSNCLSLSNGQQTDTTYDGYNITNVTNNLLTNCLADSTQVANDHRYGFASAATSDGNRFIGCLSLGHDTDFYINTADASVHEWVVPEASRQTMTADDTTPTVANSRYLITVAGTTATAFTALDDGVAGQVVTIRINSATNIPTIADAGNFVLSAAWSPNAAHETLTLYTDNATRWIELSRSDNA
jgi:parallel beta-helix repeat protein